MAISLDIKLFFASDIKILRWDISLDIKLFFAIWGLLFLFFDRLYSLLKACGGIMSRSYGSEREVRCYIRPPRLLQQGTTNWVA